MPDSDPALHPGDPTDALAALADSTRLQILITLTENGPLTATELSSRLPVSRQAVAKHLISLADAGLAEGRRTGREVRYAVVPSRLNSVAAWLEQLGRTWDRRMVALVKHLSAPGDT